MRVLLWIVGIPLVLVLLAIFLLPLLMDEQALIEIAAERIETQSGIVLRVEGGASLSLFPKASLSASDVRLSIPESNAEIEAGSLRAGVALLPLFSRRVEIDSIEVESLTLRTLAADEEAAKAMAIDTSTLTNRELDQFYVAREKTRQLAQADAAASVLAVPLALEVGQLSLRDVRVITIDDSGDTISEIQLKYLGASDLNLDGRAVPLSAEILIPQSDGAAPIEVVLAGEFTTDLDAELLTLNSLAVTVDGATPEPLKLSTSGTFSLDTQIAELDIAIDSGPTSGAGKVRYASLESPQIDATLALSELHPALLILAGPDVATDSSQPGDATTVDTALPLHSIRLIDTQAKLSIEKVVVDAHTLTDVDATLRVVDGVATLEPVTAMVHGGKIEFNAVFDAHYNRATLTTVGSVAGLDVAKAVAAMETEFSATGVANLDWTLNAAGSTSDTLADSLNGPINFTTDSIVLQGIAMEQMVCRGVALVNQESLSAEFPADTAFQDLSAQIQLANGVATLDPLTARLNALSLNGSGRFELDSEDLRASFRAQLAAALGELDPACAINERYTELRWPVECKGNLADDPADWCKVNSSEIVKDLAESELKRKAGKEAGKLLKKLFE